MGATSKTESKRIVPAKVFVKKKRGSKCPKHMGAGGKMDASTCVCLPIPLQGQNGFWAQVGNLAVFIYGMPTTGGPWVPGFYPDGRIVWVNGGGL